MAAGAIQSKVPYVPPFLAKAGLKPGEWMQTSKFTAAVLMRPNFPLKVRIIGCLMVQAHGYESELALVMSRGEFSGDRSKIVPLSLMGIAATLNKATLKALAEAHAQVDNATRHALKLRKQHVNRAIVAIEEDGIIDRVAVTCQPHQVAGLSVGEVIDKRLGTYVRDLSALARKQLHRGILMSACAPNHAQQLISTSPNASRWPPLAW